MGLNLDLNLNTKQKTLVVSLGIFIIAFILGYNFVHVANIKKAAKVKARIAEFKDAKVLLADIKGLQDKIDGYLNGRADTSDPSWFLSKVSDVATACGVTIDSINPQKASPEGNITLLPCSIKFSAPYKKAKIFIDRLENNEKFIRVESLSIAAVKVAGGSVFYPEGEFFGEDIEGISGGMLKKNKDDGIWVNINMEVAGFYCE